MLSLISLIAFSCLFYGSNADASDCKYVIIEQTVTLGTTTTITQSGYPLDYCNVISSGAFATASKYTANDDCDGVTLEYWGGSDCDGTPTSTTELTTSTSYDDLQAYGIAGEITITPNCGSNDCIIENTITTYSVSDSDCSGDSTSSITSGYVDGLCTYVQVTIGSTDTYTSSMYSCDNDEVSLTASATTSDCSSGTTVTSQSDYDCTAYSSSMWECDVSASSTGSGGDDDDNNSTADDDNDTGADDDDTGADDDDDTGDDDGNDGSNVNTSMGNKVDIWNVSGLMIVLCSIFGLLW